MVITMKAETFFSDDDRERIAAAVKEVETTTVGEIAVMVVDGSDEYPEGQILAGITLGAIFAVALVDIFLGDSLWLFLPAALTLSLVCGWLAGFMPGLKRLFIPRARFEVQVRDKALNAFYEKGLYDTRDDTGVLFFISLFERKVWVLADKGIYGKISQETLQEYADGVAAGIKRGNVTDELCREIRRIGEILAEHFPVRPDDVNELPDEVIVGS